MKYFSLSLLFVTLIFGNQIFGRIKPYKSQLGKRLKAQNYKVQKIEKSLYVLEKKLGIENKKYLDVINAKRSIDRKIINLKKEQSTQSKLLNLRYSKNSKMLALKIVQGLGSHSSSSDLLVQTILIKKLVKNKKIIKKLITSNKLLKSTIKALEKRFYEYSKTEKLVTELLKDLEFKKAGLARRYISKIKEKEDIAKQYKHGNGLARKRLNIKKILGPKFFSPMKNYQSLEFNKKGVTYKFVGRNSVVNTKRGVVVYSGRLSTYGNVVMIDHGGDTRSIILGQFVPSVEKGKKLKRGDIIGYTKNSSSRSELVGKLYFEVRKRNKVQNTILLMDRKFLKKNNLIKHQS